MKRNKLKVAIFGCSGVGIGITLLNVLNVIKYPYVSTVSFMAVSFTQILALIVVGILALIDDEKKPDDEEKKKDGKEFMKEVERFNFD